MNTLKPFLRSACAVANSLDIVGDKWSLLVVRDLLHGKQTYGELASSPERIPTNILADRLRRLEEVGIIASSPYQERPIRYAYTLTAKGRALGDVLLAFVRWGKEHIPGTMTLSEAPPRATAAASVSASRRKRPKRAAGSRRDGTSVKPPRR
ncbi:MAG TPA: helix-turn-helix domain-containing protein [Steroidobacteraceae bacterium]|nr:helix-turn-helix domain-containing protein [Steroidobacteraceae bacterium]